MPLRDLDFMLNPGSVRNSKKAITKIAIIGDSGVGKTSLMERFVNSRFTDSYNMTIGGGFYIKKLPLGKGESEMILISDVAGQSRFASIRSVFYSGVEIVLAVCDLSRKNTLTNLENLWIPEFLNLASKPDFRPKFQLIGNKSDLTDLLVISLKDLEETASKLTIKYPQITILKPILITSAKLNTFIEESVSSRKKIFPQFA